MINRLVVYNSSGEIIANEIVGQNDVLTIIAALDHDNLFFDVELKDGDVKQYCGNFSYTVFKTKDK